MSTGILVRAFLCRWSSLQIQVMSCHTIMHEHIHKWQGITIIICRHSRHTCTCNHSLNTKISSQCAGFCTQPKRSLSCTSRNIGLWVGHGECDISFILWRGKQSKKNEKDMYGFCRNSKKNLMEVHIWIYARTLSRHCHVTGGTLTIN